MKIFALILIGLTTIGSISAQDINDEPSVLLELQKFSVQYHSPNLYFNWVVRNVRNDGIFIIEKKTDSIFVPIAVKESVGVDTNFPILYSVVCEDTLFTEGIYRLRLWDDEHNMILGKEVEIKSPASKVTGLANDSQAPVYLNNLFKSYFLLKDAGK